MEDKQLRSVVEEVVARVLREGGGASVSGGGADGVFDRMEDAIEAGDRAFRDFEKQNLEQREKYIRVLRDIGLANAKEWATMTVAETLMGRVDHKIKKFEVVCRKTPGMEDLKPDAVSGDRGLTIEERAPYGLICAVTPSTHPVPTLLNNAISMLAGGNTVVFNAHPASKGVFANAVQRINKALMAAGAPPNLITCIAKPTIESADTMFKHPKTRLIMVTGGPGVVKAALAVPKKAITAGPGNPPVVVDETADIPRAAKSIIDGGGFDNNVLCIGEKEVFCVEAVYENLRRELLRQGCMELTADQIEKLTAVAFEKKGNEMLASRNLVGRNARVLAEAIGLKGVSDDCPLLIGETKFDHPFVQEEQLMPFMPLVRVRNVWEGIDMAIQAEHGYRHTACIHSKNIEHMSVFARRSDCSLFIKNGPSCAGLAVGGEGYTSFSIASPTGEGLTTARTFTRKRRCTLVDYFRIV